MPKTSYLTLDAKGRATLPEEVRQALGVGPGDFVLLEPTESGGYELVPAALVPKDQRWFQHPEMQKRGRDAEAEISRGAARGGDMAGLSARVGGGGGGVKAGAAERAGKGAGTAAKRRRTRRTAATTSA